MIYYGTFSFVHKRLLMQCCIYAICYLYFPPTFKISFFQLSFSHCLVTHLSASDSFSTMALYKSIYLLTYLLIIILDVYS